MNALLDTKKETDKKQKKNKANEYMNALLDAKKETDKKLKKQKNKKEQKKTNAKFSYQEELQKEQLFLH